MACSVGVGGYKFMQKLNPETSEENTTRGT